MNDDQRDDRPPVMLDRAAHLRRDMDQLERALDDGGSLLLPVWRDLTLIDQAQRVASLRLDKREALLDAGELVWLGRLGERACFAVDVSRLDEPLKHAALEGAGEFKDLRFAGAVLPQAEANLAAYARGMLYWHARHRYCGVCGAETAAREGGHMRECRDEGCRTKHFPRTDPAIIVLVHDGERCLVGRQQSWPKGMYSTLAGFVEPGESVEHAVAREVQEESGVIVAEPRYFRSQPWPFPSSLMLGFVARATQTDIHIGDDELEDARWITRAQLLDPKGHDFFVPGQFSLAGQLLAAFAEGSHEPDEGGGP